MELLTYPLDECGGKPLYKYIYECIRRDILAGNIPGGEKLPSKRALASNLGVSVITIENAYSLLETEGFIDAIEKKGYYVSGNVSPVICHPDTSKASLQASLKDDSEIYSKDDPSVSFDQASKAVIDFTVNYIGKDSFPFDAWARLSRRVLLDREESFLRSPEGCGVYELRDAISRYLYSAKGIFAPADRIIIGPGTEYLHHILIQLLGRDTCTAVEDPGYKKVGMIYGSNGVKVVHVPVDENGMDISILKESGARLVHLSPSHHFPTGCVMPAARRRELLSWAEEKEVYLIEDDYDSEFRFAGHPIPTLYSMSSERVIYMNTFTRSLAPSVRIAYMVLTGSLMKKYRESLGFYSSTVSAFDQYTLAEFIREGFYDRHIRRMASRFGKNRENLLSAIEESGLKEYVRIHESASGLHLMMETETTDNDINKNFRKVLEAKYIKINSLELYCYSNAKNYGNKYLLCYGDYEKDLLYKAMNDIKEAFMVKNNG